MAVERQYVNDTILNLKRALATPDDASDSDDSIAYTSNRGRKLKRRAKYVHEGLLDDRKGRNGFKEEVEYYGRRKKIIYRKQNRRKKVAVNSDEEYSDSSSDRTTSESDVPDPYEGIQIEKILAPLNSAADLPSHPSMAHIYTSTTLNELLQQSLEKISEEHEHTWKLKNLLTKFLGDDPFISMDKMEPSEDHEVVAKARTEAILREAGFGLHYLSQGGLLTPPKSDEARLVNGHAAQNGDVAKHDEDVQMAEVNGHTGPVNPDTDRDDAAVDASPRTVQNDSVEEVPREGVGNGQLPEQNSQGEESKDPSARDSLHNDDTQNSDEPNDVNPLAPRRMTTRSSNQNHPVPEEAPDSPPVEVDPFFFPPEFHVDRNYGIPELEAEETRRLLLAAVQRQEEFLRGLNRVRNDLLRTENLRKKVWDWCRSMEGMRSYHQHLSEVSGNPGKWDIDEGEHVGLSDDEDWYDMEAWGLDSPLEKGREEEDEETSAVQGKKTRRREKN